MLKNHLTQVVLDGITGQVFWYNLIKTETIIIHVKILVHGGLVTKHRTLLSRL